MSLFVYCVFFLIILIANYPFGKTIIGWDAINPELNFAINFKRAFFAFWQENYGTGLLGGHGFAATLPHTIIAFILSIFLPTHAIRPVITFICLFIGGLGVYYLVRFLLNDPADKPQSIQFTYNDIFACIGALFYIVNIGTIQMFYVQLEVFIFHFAALPWLFLSLIIVLENKLSKKNLFGFIIINFIASVQSFVPPLFVAYMIAVMIIFFSFLVGKRFSPFAIKRVCLIFLLILFINLYWFIPFLYYTKTLSGTYLDSYNNIISTPEFIEKNKNFGDIFNVLLLKGFLFTNNIFSEPLLGEWVGYFNSTLVQVAGYILVSLSLLGLANAFLKLRNWKIMGLAGIFVFFFTALTTNSPPFSFITDFLQAYVPLYKQAFRFSFTKFSLGLAFSYSLFIPIGLCTIDRMMKKIKLLRSYSFMIASIFFIILTFYTFPLFKGNLFYKRLIINLPSAYTETMAYFATQTDGRIADFPQDCPDGWYTYNWGYTGSGFYWYGIQQPFLSRTFDVWHNANENYYWEITNALRMKKYDRVDTILQKYGARWVLYDGNLKHCRNERALLQDEQLLDYLVNSGKYTLQKKILSQIVNPIYIFEVNNPKITSYVSLSSKTPVVSPAYNFTDYDVALDTYPTYNSTDKQPDVLVPFRSLFNKRVPSEHNFDLTQEDDTFYLRSTVQIPKSAPYILNIPAYSQIETVVPVALQIDKIGTAKYSLTAHYLFPTISIDNKQMYPPAGNSNIVLGTFQTEDLNKNKLVVNDKEFTFDEYSLPKVFFYTQVDNFVYVLDKNDETKNPLLTWNGTKDPLHNLYINSPFLVSVPLNNKSEIVITFSQFNNGTEIGKEYIGGFINNLQAPCDSPNNQNQNWNEVGTAKATEYIRLISKNDSQCLNFNFNDMQTGLGYILQTEIRNISGLPTRIEVSNKKGSYYLSTYLETKNEFNISNIILPPTYKDTFGYQVVLKNYSLNDSVSENDYMRVGLWYLPYNFITKLTLTNPNLTNGIDYKNALISIDHPNETEYQIKISNENLLGSDQINLFQSYHSGWRAYYVGDFTWVSRTFPFFFGKEIKEHILVNNWANGWSLEEQQNSNITHVVIVFLPQYLQYIGFALLGLCFAGIFFWKSKK
jgi:hypothetical protein